MIHLSDTALAGAAVMRARWLCQLQCCNRSWDFHQKFHQKIWTSMSPSQSPFPILCTWQCLHQRAVGLSVSSEKFRRSNCIDRRTPVREFTTGTAWKVHQQNEPSMLQHKKKKKWLLPLLIVSFSKPIQTNLNHSIQKKNTRSASRTYYIINKNNMIIWLIWLIWLYWNRSLTSDNTGSTTASGASASAAPRGTAPGSERAQARCAQAAKK